MKKLTLALTIALALPLLADDAKKSAEAATESPKTTTAAEPAATTETSAPAAAAPEPVVDSPLVAAAKRAGRNGRKPSGTVITNQTLAESGANAHITTTRTQAPVNVARSSTPREPSQAERDAKAAKEKAAAAEAAKNRKNEEAEKARKAAAAEDGYDGEMRDDAEEVLGGTPPPSH